MSTFTQRLLAAQKEGKAVVCSRQPYEGWPVTHAARNDWDSQPWKLLHQDGSEWPGSFRYSGRECHSVDQS